MKIWNIKNIEEFLKVVDSCEGKVELLTEEGDRLNLKSQLTKFIAFNKLFGGDASMIPKMEIMTSDPGDAIKLLSFMAG